MNRTWLYLAFVVVVAFVLVLAGCPSKPPADTGGGPVAGGGAPPPPPPGDTGEEPAGDTALTKELVKSFMASMDDDNIEKIMDEIVDGLGVEDEDSPEAIKQAIEEAGKSDKLAEAVKAHGFNSAEEWVATAKKVMPGLAEAMAKVMAETLGVEAGSEEYKKMVDESEFAELGEAFDEKPSEADLQVIMECLKESMEAEMGEAGAAAPSEAAPE